MDNNGKEVQFESPDRATVEKWIREDMRKARAFMSMIESDEELFQMVVDHISAKVEAAEKAKKAG